MMARVLLALTALLACGASAEQVSHRRALKQNCQSLGIVKTLTFGIFSPCAGFGNNTIQAQVNYTGPFGLAAGTYQRGTSLVNGTITNSEQLISSYRGLDNSTNYNQGILSQSAGLNSGIQVAGANTGLKVSNNSLSISNIGASAQIGGGFNLSQIAGITFTPAGGNTTTFGTVVDPKQVGTVKPNLLGIFGKK